MQSMQILQTEPTKPNLPNQTYLTKPTKPKLLVKAVNAWVCSAFGNVSSGRPCLSLLKDMYLLSIPDTGEFATWSWIRRLMNVSNLDYWRFASTKFLSVVLECQITGVWLPLRSRIYERRIKKSTNWVIMLSLFQCNERAAEKMSGLERMFW